MKESVSGTLVICPTCKEPWVMVNGISTQTLEFRKVSGKTVVTPHAPDCSAI